MSSTRKPKTRAEDSTDDVAARKLVDRLVPDVIAHGRLEGVVATTYGMQAEFLETDFLPMALGQSGWNDQSWTSRIALERQLAHLEAVVVMMDGRCYTGRPRSLRVETRPSVGARGQKLHAKVVLLVHENAVRLVVASANLTTPGYRSNREVACTLTATRKNPAAGVVIREALRDMPQRLTSWWTVGAGRVHARAIERLAEFGVPASSADDDDTFAWGGDSSPLWSQFLSRWPVNEKVEQIHIVSPFWSNEGGPGPFSKMFSELGARAAGCSLRLLANAQLYGANDLRPCLPATLGMFDFKKYGIRASAHAVNPAVLKEEVGTEDFLGTRQLHAKVVLLEGPKTSLCYLGSANFTRHGWGFSDPLGANVEAGLILRRRGKVRAAELKTLLPACAGAAVPLDGSATGSLGDLVSEGSESAWPSFLLEARLAPCAADSTKLELHLLIDDERIDGDWSVSFLNGVELHRSDMTPEGKYRIVALDTEGLNQLLNSQEICVRWWKGPPDGARYPINVHDEGRAQLPIAPGTGLPGEGALLLYYQGKIPWQDLFPNTGSDDEDDDGEKGKRRAEAEKSTVDTSKIQSYQIRSFVEALHGLSGDIKEASRSEPRVLFLWHLPVQLPKLGIPAL